jgi:hypothetical protein
MKFFFNKIEHFIKPNFLVIFHKQEILFTVFRRSTSSALEAEKLEELIGNLEKIFHSKHYLVLQVKLYYNWVGHVFEF